MKAAFVTKYGGPEVLEIRETEIPVPKPHEILVRVRVIGLNFADIFGRFGVYPGTPKPPFIPGLELAGDVERVGDGVQLFSGGERVMGYSRLGSHAEYVAIDEKLATVMPDAMSYGEGAAFLATYLSAYHGIIRLANARAGEKLLIHASAGGVGLASVQLGRHLGCEVFGTAGSDEKVEFVKAQGAHHVINYVSSDFARDVKTITNGYGVDIVMDSVGGETFRKSWELLAQMGRYVLYGVTSVTGKGALNRLRVAKTFSFMKPIFPPNLISANKGIFGFNLGTLREKEGYFHEAVTSLISMYNIGALKPVIGKVFPFRRIVHAHRVLQMRRSIGKVVVLVNE